MAAWIPTNFEEACKRNAGRRKLHMSNRKARADRIVRLLASTTPARTTELRRTRYGSLTPASLAMAVSKATASRDFALVRRIHGQFVRMFGRNFDRRRDQVVWEWNWASYGFITPESKAEGNPKAVGHFPFDTRKQETEESYGGFSALSWENKDRFSHLSTRELMRAYGRVVRMRERPRIPKKFFENFLRQNGIT